MGQKTPSRYWLHFRGWTGTYPWPQYHEKLSFISMTVSFLFKLAAIVLITALKIPGYAFIS